MRKSRNSRFKYIKIPTQDIYDSLMLLVTGTIGSEDFCNTYNVYRSQVMYPNNWNKFTQNINAKTNLPKGIYPLWIDTNLGIDEVHYWGVFWHNEKGCFVTGNGYPTPGEGLDGRLAYGLDLQENNSHGLCMIYALMFSELGPEGIYKMGLRKGEYIKNVSKGLNWVRKWIHTNRTLYPYEWDREALINEIPKREVLWILNNLGNNGIVKITDIIGILNSKVNKGRQIIWYN